MKITLPCIEGRLIKRYKRFLADIELIDGRKITAHTPNTGSMNGCSTPGSRVWVYDTQNPARKYQYSWDLVENTEGHLIGIHTGRPNYLVREAIENGVITELQGYKNIKLEAKYTRIKTAGKTTDTKATDKQTTGTRFDVFLSGHATKKDCYVEVKNVTAKRGKDIAIFPDAVTTRGLKHLLMLEDAVKQGYRAAMVYCIQREDINAFAAAHEFDADYAAGLKHAKSNGVEVLAYKAKISPSEILLVESVRLA